MIHATKRSQVEGERSVTPNSILAEILRDLVTASDAGRSATPVFRESLARAASLASGLDGYLEQCSSPPSSALVSLMQQTRDHDWYAAVHRGDVSKLVEKEMLSGPVEGLFLQMLLRISGAYRVLDLGVFTGYSALAMAEAIPDHGVVVGCELEPVVAQFARDAIDATGSTDAKKIKILVGDACETLKDLSAQNQVFDFVFLDADKANYIRYLTLLRENNLLVSGGLVCVDNTLMQGEPYSDIVSPNGKSISDFNEFVKQDDKLKKVIIPLRDGITLIQVDG